MEKLPDEMRTISSESESRLKEKGSFFIAISKPVENEEEVQTFLYSIRKKYYDATHHCYSYRFVNGSFKYSDDGEPGGTAGKRIFNAQNHFGLTNLTTVVVRFFGGVKLGVGPLGKAYYDSAFESLNSAKIEEKMLYSRLEIRYIFDNSSLVHHLISKYKLKIEESRFEPEPVISALILDPQASRFEEEIRSVSNNKIRIKKSDELLYLKK